MNLYRRFDQLGRMRLESNDQVLQAGLGFVAHAKLADSVCDAGELGRVAS
jgi:NAD(P)H-dependent flavin oxidoreductase YrpB (nitropropane dioxygenase family)